MYSVMRMGGKLYAMKTVDSLDDFNFDAQELERSQTFINEGTPVIFCEDLDDLDRLFLKPEAIEIIERNDD